MNTINPEINAATTEFKLPKKANKLYGKRFGRLTALRPVSIGPSLHVMWLCECDCGVLKPIDGSRIATGRVKSCGCLRLEAMSVACVTHGHMRNRRLTGTIISWIMMKDRCLNPKHKDFKNYGGRGITICDRWLSYSNFLADMGIRPPGMTLDRKNNNLGYDPENCVWATPKDQCRNKRNNRLIDFSGRVMPMVVWSEEIGINCQTLRSRLNYGWSVERALTEPTQNHEHTPASQRMDGAPEDRPIHDSLLD